MMRNKILYCLKISPHIINLLNVKTMIITLQKIQYHFCVFLPKMHNLTLNHTEALHKPKMRDSLQNDWPLVF